MGRHATSLKAAEARIGMPFVDFVNKRFSEGKCMADIVRELGIGRSQADYWLLQAGLTVETTHHSRLVRTGGQGAERRVKK